MDEVKAKLLVQKINASIEMLEQVKKDLLDFLQTEDVKEEVAQVAEFWLGDDGKEYSYSQPYKKAKQWYCCGKPLGKVVKDGKEVYHCSQCNSDYRA